jgi:outer membrane protein OmpA-like peptidoglycan-associated protein
MLRRWGVTVALALVPGFSSPPEARAQAEAETELPIEVQVLQMVNLPEDSPRITLTAGERVDKLRVSVLERGRRVAGRSLAVLGPGATQSIVWRAQPGVHEYTVQVAGRSARGPATVSVETVVTVMRPLQVKLEKKQVDLEERLLFFSLNNPAGGATLTVRAPSGRVLHEATTDLSGRPAGTRLEVRWPELPEPIERMQLRIRDASDSWSDFELLPFSVEIPHEDVIFETAQHAIRSSETPKLEAAYDAILEAIAAHGSDLKARLYVLGHTDTVGAPGDNQQLSDRRAVAIARWFADRGGISLPILARGFGEGQLLIKTADNVDEARNRRAQYILAAQAPVASAWTTVSAGKAAR